MPVFRASKENIVKWFHDSEEICEHDTEWAPCEIMAHHFLINFDVGPIILEYIEKRFEKAAHEPFGCNSPHLTQIEALNIVKKALE